MHPNQCKQLPLSVVGRGIATAPVAGVIGQTDSPLLTLNRHLSLNSDILFAQNTPARTECTR
jgi:hypothetical protein